MNLCDNSDGSMANHICVINSNKTLSVSSVSGYFLIINTVIRLIFVVKIFLYTENIRNYFTLNFCDNKYFRDEYLEQSTCAYAVHAVFVALWILEGYGWTMSIRLKPMMVYPI